MGSLHVTGVEQLTLIATFVTLIGLPAALAGLCLGWVQLRRTKTAAEAARETGEAVRQQLKGVQLAWLLPHLQATERELQTARDTDTALHVLSRWRNFAPQGEAILRRDMQAPSGLAEELRATVGYAVSAETSLQEGDEVRQALRVALPAIMTCNYNIAVHVASVSYSLQPIRTK